MQIIAYGYKLAELSDKDFWESYNFDIVRLASHNHDGNNSAHLAPGASYPYLQVVTIGDWVGTVPNLTYDFLFPIPWMMTWPLGTQSPVLATVRNPAGSIIHLKQTAIRDPLTNTWGIQFETAVALDCNIEII
jgi:hypothetical protein